MVAKIKENIELRSKENVAYLEGMHKSNESCSTHYSDSQIEDEEEHTMRSK